MTPNGLHFRIPRHRPEGTGYAYAANRKRRTTCRLRPGYDPKLRKHVLLREVKA